MFEVLDAGLLVPTVNVALECAFRLVESLKCIVNVFELDELVRASSVVCSVRDNGVDIVETLCHEMACAVVGIFDVVLEVYLLLFTFIIRNLYIYLATLFK